MSGHREIVIERSGGRRRVRTARHRGSCPWRCRFSRRHPIHHTRGDRRSRSNFDLNAYRAGRRRSAAERPVTTGIGRDGFNLREVQGGAGHWRAGQRLRHRARKRPSRRRRRDGGRRGCGRRRSRAATSGGAEDNGEDKLTHGGEAYSSSAIEGKMHGLVRRHSANGMKSLAAIRGDVGRPWLALPDPRSRFRLWLERNLGALREEIAQEEPVVSPGNLTIRRVEALFLSSCSLWVPLYGAHHTSLLHDRAISSIAGLAPTRLIAHLCTSSLAKQDAVAPPKAFTAECAEDAERCGLSLRARRTLR